MQGNNEKSRKRLSKLFRDPDKINGKKLSKALPGLADSMMRCKEEGSIGSIKGLQDGLREYFETELWNKQFVWWLARLAAPGSGSRHVALQERLVADTHRLAEWQLKRKEDDEELPPLLPCSGIIRDCWIIAVHNHRKDIISTCFADDKIKFLQSVATQEAIATPELEIMFKVQAEPILRNRRPDEMEELCNKFASAAIEVQHGVHESIKICWGCGEESKFDCTSCQAAKYCSKICQILHWEVHKHTCRTIKKLFLIFENGMDVVSEAFANPKAHKVRCGVEPSFSDYSTVSGSLKDCFLRDMKDHGQTTMGPSMTNFYKNIGRVFMEGFWINQRPNRTKTDMPNQSTGNPAHHEYIVFLQAMLYGYTDGELLLDQFHEKVQYIAHSYGLTGAIRLTPEEWLSYYQVKTPEDERYRQMLMKRTTLDFFKDLRAFESSKNWAVWCKQQRTARRETSRHESLEEID